MTARQKEIAKEIRRRIYELRNALQEALARGVGSASISQGGASSSYTVISLAELRKEISRLENELATIRRAGRSRMILPDFRIYEGYL